jgi:hypothetical protein
MTSSDSNGLLLSEVFPASDRPSEFLGFAPNLLELTPAALLLRQLLRNPLIVRPWIQKNFYRAYLESGQADRDIRRVSSGAVGLSDLQDRILVMGRHPGLLILDPHLGEAVPRITNIPEEAMPAILEALRAKFGALRESLVNEFGSFLEADPHAIIEDEQEFCRELVEAMFATSYPLIGVGGRPELETVTDMRTTTGPPALAVTANGETSTAGVLARDKSGQWVMTMAYHGTGDVGTDVKIGDVPSKVVAADRVVDASLAPFTPSLEDIELRVLTPLDRSPGQEEPVHFCGATSGSVQTVMHGVDLDVPYASPGEQTKVYTPPVVNSGDSGTALLNSASRVVGFAFKKTSRDRPLRYGVWIWAKCVFAAFDLR